MQEILAETLEVLRYHVWRDRGDKTSLDVFNRLLAKQINGPDGDPLARMNFSPEQIRSSREQRTTSELAGFPKWHDHDNPNKTDCPIIVAVFNGTEYLLDGHTRINYWQKIRDEGPHDVNVHIVDA